MRKLPSILSLCLVASLSFWGCNAEFNSDEAPPTDAEQEVLAEGQSPDTQIDNGDQPPQSGPENNGPAHIQEAGGGDDNNLPPEGDTDGDGVVDSMDLCPGTDDALRGIRYQDKDLDGMIVPSSNDLCDDDGDFPIAASRVLQYLIDNPDPDDNDIANPHVDYKADSVTELSMGGVDFDGDGDSGETDNIYRIGSVKRWLDWAAECNGAVSTACWYQAIVTKDLDWAVLDGSAEDDGPAGDGKFTVMTSTKVLGTQGQSFRGVIDGSGFEFKNLIVDMRPEAGVDKGCGVNTECDAVGGLAGVYSPHADFKFVRNLTVQADVYGGKATGGITAKCSLRCRLEGVHHEGEVLSDEGSTSGVAGIGGLVGYYQGGFIIGCSNKGSVASSVNKDAGGIAGYSYNGNASGGYIENVANYSSVQSLTGSAGGILGDTSSNTLAYNDIRRAFNAGDVSGRGSVGGIIGMMWNYTNLDDVYNIGTVTNLNPGNNRAGGIIGYYGTTISMNNAYSVGVVRAFQPGGIVGGSDAQYASSKGFFLTGTVDSDNDGDIDGDDVDADNYTSTALSDAQMRDKTNFTGFDFGTCTNGTYTNKADCEGNAETWTQVWDIDQGNSYPYLIDLVPETLPGT